MMTVRELLLKNRSYRRFYQQEKIPSADLKNLIANVRISPSPANLQPLKFVLVNHRETNSHLFAYLNWAAYLKEWDGPEQGERPSAYIVFLGDKKLSGYLHWDYGIALQTILLSAVEKGLGGCAIASFNKEKVRELLRIPEYLEIGLVIALGKPKEKVVIDEVKDGDIKYWRDKDQVHHVPKRSLDDLIYKVIE
jgi:nitroreductase